MGAYVIANAIIHELLHKCNVELSENIAEEAAYERVQFTYKSEVTVEIKK